MKCPKCGYLGFDEVVRCRNCGHDFSVAASGPGAELPLRNVSASLEDLPDLEWSRPEPADLPLFLTADANAAPVQTLPHVPASRPPLAVRRATPDTPRVRIETPRTPMLDLEPAEPVVRDMPAALPSLPLLPRPPRHPLLPEDVEPATLGTRALAAVIDLFVLGLIDAIVIYFTLQICGLTVADLWRLPKGPLLAFLLLQNGAYFAAFTAGGQTLGKMSAGIRVVSVDGPRLDLGRSLKRTVLWGLLAIPAGLGFATAWFDADRRGLHDRLTGTRVVRSGAA